MDLRYEALNDELVRRVPELAPALARMREEWGDEEPGPHVVYGDLLVPYFEEAAYAAKPPASFSAAIELIDEMVASFGDVEIKNVAGASVLEPLSANPDAWALVHAAMGPHTRELANKIYRPR